MPLRRRSSYVVHPGQSEGRRAQRAVIEEARMDRLTSSEGNVCSWDQFYFIWLACPYGQTIPMDNIIGEI